MLGFAEGFVVSAFDDWRLLGRLALGRSAFTRERSGRPADSVWAEKQRLRRACRYSLIRYSIIIRMGSKKMGRCLVAVVDEILCKTLLP